MVQREAEKESDRQNRSPDNDPRTDREAARITATERETMRETETVAKHTETLKLHRIPTVISQGRLALTPPPKSGADLPTRPNHKRKNLLAAARTLIDQALPSVGAHFPPVEITDPRVLAHALAHTFAPAPWAAATDVRAPMPGSVVEFRAGAAVRLGIVERAPAALFDERANRLAVRTLDDDTAVVPVHDITFVAPQVLAEQWQNGDFSDFVAVSPAALLVHQFVALADQYHPQAVHALHKHHAAVAADWAAPTSLAAAAAVVCAPRELPSYFHQGALLWALHREMSTDAARWSVAAAVPANVAWRRCLNHVAPALVYLANSVATMDAVTEFLASPDTEVEAVDLVLADLVARPRAPDEVAHLFNIWQRRHRGAVGALRHAVAHPHPCIMARLARMRVFGKSKITDIDAGKMFQGETFESVSSDAAVSSRDVYQLLVSARVYDTATDILYSSGAAGTPRSLFAVSSAADLLLLPAAQAYERDRPNADHFPHLRSLRPYYSDLVVYAVVGTPFAFSLETVSTRRYKLNVHVLDVAAQISPASLVFDHWALSAAYFSPRATSPIGARWPVLAGSGPGAPFFRVGDGARTAASGPTCLTISLDYLPSDNDPLKDLSPNVSISFDCLDLGCIRPVEMAQLDAQLTGKLEPSLLAAFRLFGRAHLPPPVSPADHFNMNFFYNVLTRHFTARNRRCGATADGAVLKKTVTVTKSGAAAEQDDGTTEPEDASDNVTISSARGIKDTVNAGFVEPTLDISVVALTTPRADFFVREIGVLAAAMAGEYCTRENIPAYFESHDVVDADSVDEVYIAHDNRLLPNFHAASYFQTILARDAAGNVSPAAYFAGNNFLAPAQLRTRPGGMHLLLGLARAVVDVALYSMEAYFNQLQLVAHAHARAVANVPYIKLVTRFSHLKAWGYPMHGPLTTEVLENQLQGMEDSRLGAKYFSERHERFWKLRHVEQAPGRYSCIITRAGPTSHNSAIWWGFCQELSMEISIETDGTVDLFVGAVVDTDDVVYIDAVAGICIVKYSPPF